MNQREDPDAWARLRFAIISSLLVSPPAHGQLRAALQALAAHSWRHPVTGVTVRYSWGTLERWYYRALKADDPVAALRPRPRRDRGHCRRVPAALHQALQAQYQAHSGWTVQLHYDNLCVLAKTDAGLGELPSYNTLRRYMKAQGWHRKKTPKHRSVGAQQAEQRLAQREVRSYEVSHVNALWHADFHHGSRRIVTASGRWETPLLLCFIDDHSRLVCHLQWYLQETAEVLVHGLRQALQKRGLPRALMTDNGSAMLAEELTAGLHQLGIRHETTLPYSPYQNAKQETFWATVEGRLVAMLEGIPELTLKQLNELTQAWVEQEYHYRRHTELAAAPLDYYLKAETLARPCPDRATLRQAFRCTVKRKQRRSDGTVSVQGQRFDIPARYRHLEWITLRYARWDLSSLTLIDPKTLHPLCPVYPLDKQAHADGLRRAYPAPDAVLSEEDQSATDELPPLLRQCLEDYAATGCPPAYLPLESES